MSNHSDSSQNDPRFRCCCQFCHIKKGSTAVAIGSMIFASYFLIKSFAFLGRNIPDYRATTVLTLIVALIWLIVSIVLLIGVRREVPVLLMPFMVVQIAIIVLSATLGLLCIVYLAVGRAGILGWTGATDREPRSLRTHEDHLRLMILVGIQAAVYGLVLAFGVWFFVTILQCYRWLKEKKSNEDVQSFKMEHVVRRRV